ncbi:phospholipase A2-like [Ptychodera flava]|uniref:phospholipase A2-like n=1 Tax=Ptychodera flava TaxID=63121 RepID=UPI00396A6A86
MNTLAAFLLILSFVGVLLTVRGNSIKRNPGLSTNELSELVRQRKDLANYIYPGTKWCGKGDVAEDENDLGEFVATDKCCRQHDHCPRYIEAFSTDYNTFNPFPYTVSDCDCDEEFYKCLKDAHTMVSGDLGKLFFNELRVPCLDFDEEDVCIKKSFLGWGCSEYGKGTKAKFDNSFDGNF